MILEGIEFNKQKNLVVVKIFFTYIDWFYLHYDFKFSSNNLFLIIES